MGEIFMKAKRSITPLYYCMATLLFPSFAYAGCSDGDLKQCTTQQTCEEQKGTWASGQCSDGIPIVSVPEQSCSEGSLSNCTLPPLTSVFSLNSTSGAPSTAATSFKGGIAVSTNGQLAPYAIDNQSLNQGDTIVVSGTITPLAAHLGKTADILVVGLYKAKVDSTVDNCDPAGGEYYMNTADSTFTDNYCNWINGGISTTCNTQDRTTRSARQPSEYWQRWNGHLTTELKPYQQAILTDPLDLPILYKDKLNHAGHVCINFGYRLTDGTIVFNGEPIKYQVK
jgi:hypothetical protein